MDIYLDASRLGIYPPLFISPSGDNCILFAYLPLNHSAILRFSQGCGYSLCSLNKKKKHRFCYITMKCLTSFRQIRFKNEVDIRCMCKVCCPFRIAAINSLYTLRSGRVVKSKKSKNRKCRRIVESEETNRKSRMPKFIFYYYSGLAIIALFCRSRITMSKYCMPSFPLRWCKVLVQYWFRSLEVLIALD